MLRRFYVYEWFREVDKKVFYVGKGSRRRAGSRTHRNFKFINMINEYECDYNIVERNMTEEEAFAKEIELIAKYRKLFPYINCNILDGGEPNNVEHLRKPVVMCNLKGNIIREFGSITEASEETGIDDSCISKCCRKLSSYKSSGGYMWHYKGDEEISLYTNERTKPKSIYKLDLNGGILKGYNSIYIAAKENNMKTVQISRCCSEKQKSANGFMWSYKEEYKNNSLHYSNKKTPKKILAIKGSIKLEFKSIVEANYFFNKEKDCRKIIKKCCDNDSLYKTYTLSYKLY